MNRQLSNRADGMLPGSTLRDEAERRRGLTGYSSLARVTGSGAPITDEKASQEIFVIKLNNFGGTDQMIALFSGALLTKEEILTYIGIQVAAIAKNGVVVADKVSCTSKPGFLLEHFQRYLNQNPTRVIRFKIESNEEDQMGESIVFSKFSPVKKLGNQEVNPSNAKRQQDTQGKLVIIDRNDIQLDDQTVVYVNLLAGRTLNITMFLGAAINNGYNLEQMAKSIR